MDAEQQREILRWQRSHREGWCERIVPKLADGPTPRVFVLANPSSARPYRHAIASPDFYFASRVSSRALTSALDGARALCPQSCGARAGFQASSCDEFLVRDASARSCFDETVEPFHRAALNVAIVKPEGELVNVAGKVLGAGVMIDAGESALQHGPYRFDAVGADAVAHVFAC